MKRILHIVLAMWMLIAVAACQQTTTQSTTTAKNTGTLPAKNTETAASNEKCPIQEMGIPCESDGEKCPIAEGKGPCDNCKSKAGQIEEKMQTLSQQWGMALQAEDYDKALGILKQMDETLSNNSNVKASFAYTYTLKGDYDNSLAIYNEMLKDFPDNPNLLGNIANIYTMKGDNDKALGIYNKLLERFPNEPSITDAVACTYMKKGDYDKTIELYNNLLKAEPKATFAYYNMCCAYSLKGSKKEACEYLNKSVESGYFDWKHMEKDTDLDNIRGEDAYKKILGTLKTNYPDGTQGGCGGDCDSCPVKEIEKKSQEGHKHMHDGCDQCPDHDKCLKEGKCAGDCDKKMKDAKNSKCTGDCDHKDGKEDPKCGDNCEHKNKK
ncbi:MAG: tetratricopeptide repeat protein [Planctomycetes bacterium]|nr:tetratricopeptide repeat protein [Planctomycetota bacterium]